MYHDEVNFKKAGMVTLISNEEGFRTRITTREKETFQNNERIFCKRKNNPKHLCTK